MQTCVFALMHLCFVQQPCNASAWQHHKKLHAVALLLNACRPVDAAAKAAPAAAVPQLNAVSESVMFGSTAKAASLNTADKQQQQQQQPDPGQEASSSRPTARTTQAPAAAAAAAPEAMAGCVTRRGSQRLSQPAAGAQAPGSVDERAPGRGAVSVSGSASRLAALGIEDVDAAPMFLERVVMWWCGVPAGSSEHLELHCILHAYAGVRFPDLCEATTHIMVRRGRGAPSEDCCCNMLAAAGCSLAMGSGRLWHMHPGGGGPAIIQLLAVAC